MRFGEHLETALGTVGGGDFWRGGRRRAVMRVQVQACGHLDARCLILSRPPARSPTRARRTRSAARMSTARAPPAEGVRGRRSAWPAGSAANAACAMPCAAPAITAKTVSALAPSALLGPSRLCPPAKVGRTHSLLGAGCPAADQWLFRSQGSPEPAALPGLVSEDRTLQGSWSSLFSSGPPSMS